MTIKFRETANGISALKDGVRIARITYFPKQSYYRINVYSKIGNVAAVVGLGLAKESEVAKANVLTISKLLETAKTCKDEKELISKSEINLSIARAELVLAAANRIKLPEKDNPVQCLKCLKNCPFDFFKIDYCGSRTCPMCGYNGENNTDQSWKELFGESA